MLFTEDRWINPPNYYKLYARWCDICGEEFDTNNKEDDVCQQCIEHLEDQCQLVENIIEQLEQLDYQVEGQAKFVYRLETLQKELYMEV